MKLYHYSVNMYKELRTRKASMPRSSSIEGSVGLDGILTQAVYSDSLRTAKKYHKIGSYYDHISFFFDPIPSGIIGKLFENHHDYWYDGNMLFEHVIDTADIRPGFVYEVVETPATRRMREEDTTPDTPEDLDRYLIALAAMRVATGERGEGVRQLNKQIERFVGGTERAYIEARKMAEWEENKTKYAANVPHVMIYPQLGTIPVRNVNKIIIGNNARKPFNTSFEALTSLSW